MVFKQCFCQNLIRVNRDSEQRSTIPLFSLSLSAPDRWEPDAALYALEPRVFRTVRRALRKSPASSALKKERPARCASSTSCQSTSSSSTSHLSSSPSSTSYSSTSSNISTPSYRHCHRRTTSSPPRRASAQSTFPTKTRLSSWPARANRWCRDPGRHSQVDFGDRSARNFGSRIPFS